MLLAEFVRPIGEADLTYTEFASGIDQYLKKRGYKFLGQGIDQMAFQEPGSDWVLKIFGTGMGGRPNPGHKMFFIWAQFCMANSGNPFLPRFAGYERFEWKGSLYLQIRQERLRPNRVISQAVSRLGDHIQLYAEGGAADVKILAAARSKRDLKKFTALDYLDDGSFDLLVRTTTALYRMGRTRGWWWDLHPDNVMIRPDRTPVLVDPWTL
jgi:hypothetical protein